MSEIFELCEATIFPDLNKKESQPADFARPTLPIEKLKYKHIRAALKHPEADQMHHLMMMLTGLSEDDMGELSPQDAAKMSVLLYEGLMQFNQLNPAT